MFLMYFFQYRFFFVFIKSRVPFLLGNILDQSNLQTSQTQGQKQKQQISINVKHESIKLN